MAKQPNEIKKNAIGSQNSEAERTGAMLVGRRRSVDPEADSAKLRSLFTLMFISVPIFIGVTTVFVSSLFADPEQSTVGITPNEERLVKEPVTVQTRWQEGIEAIVSKNSSTASACITFEPPLKKDTRIRYEDYVELKPVQSGPRQFLADRQPTTLPSSTVGRGHRPAWMHEVGACVALDVYAAAPVLP